MATKAELTGALDVLIRETQRIGERFSDDEWVMAAEEAGWTNKQVLAHIAAVGSVVVPMIGGMASAPAGSDLGANVNVDAMNAQLVAARAGKSVGELVDEVAASYGGVIEYLRTAPDALLERRATVGGYAEMTISDITMQMVALHGLAHLYHAASRFG
ncbi:MAG: DinB family protein [Dehalococcoidia bacterium]|nr:DinB family protein [Dehalococcoidia bacterium]